ncbi:hypothetical protein [Streptomyces sp. NPDC087270]|uniref:hypothetical protein n=1 Tax=Streptomyces sp. NPDC087270 TaxID=3365774 RepID=UPI003822F15C
MVLLEVRSRAVGVPDGPTVPAVWLEVAADEAVLTLREIVGRAVEAQLAAADAADREGAAPGSKRPRAARSSVGAQFRSGPDRTEPVGGAAAETERAMAAIDRGLVAVFAGGRRLESPDEPVAVRPGDRITFLRVTALVGG